MTTGKIKFVEDDGPVDADMEVEEEEGEDDGDEEVEAVKLEEEPPTKKLKTDVTKEAEAMLDNYNGILEESGLSITEKFAKISTFLEYLHENNVNTLAFQKDFTEWAKGTLVTLIGEVSVTSLECYNFLCSVLKVAPTIVEPVCEKILEVVFVKHAPCEECDHAREVFMEKLSYTFERLRRFPKLIAKLLHCVRNNIAELVKPKRSSKKRKSTGGGDNVDPQKVSGAILGKIFMESYSAVISMLPSGQISDLWKTLQHNLEEECVKKLKADVDNPCLITYLTVVGDLTASFLYNIKVADYSVPLSTVERVKEVMSKLKDHTLTDLGEMVTLKNDTSLARPFLKLSMAWGYLNQFMIIYNASYGHSLPDLLPKAHDAEDLSMLLSYLSGAQWKSLWKTVAKSGDVVCTRIMVSLVALKLNCLAVIDQRRKELKEESILERSRLGNEAVDEEPDADQMNLNRCTQETAEFVWNHQESIVELGDDSLLCGLLREDILDIASAYMDHEKLIEYAKMFLDNALQPVEKHSSIENVTFHVALILEALQEGLKRVAKMNLMKRPVKKFLTECLSSGCKGKMLEGIERKGSKLEQGVFFGELKTFLIQAVEIVNDAILEKRMKKGGSGSEEHMPDLLKEIISFLGQQQLGQYPKTVKTLVFLCSSLIFTAVIGHEEYKDVVEELVCLLSECEESVKVNELLFHVKWSDFFQLVTEHSQSFSHKACERLCKLVLENIYVSPKTATEFGEKQLGMVKESFELGMKTSATQRMSLYVLEFILQDLVEKGSKSKASSLLLSHTKELAADVIAKLSDGSIITELHSLIQPLKKTKKGKKKGGGDTKLTPSTMKPKLPNSFVSGVMHACYLLLKGKPYMNDDDLSEYKVIVLPYLHFALDFMEVCSNCDTESREKMTMEIDNSIDGEMTTSTSLFHCVQFLLESLKSIEEFRPKLAQDFMLRLWLSSCALNADDDESRKIGPKKGMLKSILEVANEEELQSICDWILQKMGMEDEQILVATILSSLVEAEMGNEKKKQTRRLTVELGLFKNLANSSKWKDSDNFADMAIPYLQFQTALIRRRKPMGNLQTLAVSLTSITAIPLDKIEDVDKFKKVFSQVCELLNSLTMHRLDMLSYRTHIFLQCFQFVVESLVKRADQRNKLTDREIYDLRHCGHCIERICQSAKLGRQEFTRSAPYLVVVLLRQFEKITVYPIVKNPLLNGCYKLLDMCDDNGISHVNSMLSVGSREIFKAVYEQYKKFYRYKGKV